MEKRVKITIEESEKVRNLHETYLSYMNVLQFFMNQTSVSNQEMLDKKWNEATEVNRALEQAQREIEKKYKPKGFWQRFEFDFDNHEVVFITNGT